LTFHFNWLEGQRGYLPANWDVLWSLSVEETFYVLFPLACLALRRERSLLICMLALITIGPLYRVSLEGREPWDDYAYLSCMDGIAFGCIAAWIAARVRISRSVMRGAMMLGAAAVMLIVVFREQTLDLGLTKLGLNVTILEMGVSLVLLALAGGVGNATLSKGTTLLQMTGRCSYEIYLTHMFVVLGLMHPFRALFDGMVPGRMAYASIYATMLALSVLLGYAVARWVSEPLNNMLRDKYAAPARPPRAIAPLVH
jgi:peptidoglycan/LPS O-acetylase OafA/YrhL